MDILGIGPLELIVILVLALLVFGPDRLPEIGAKLGRSMRSMRQATREFSREIEEARKAIEEPANAIRQPMQDLMRPVQDIRDSTKDLTQTAQSLSQAAGLLQNPAGTIRDSVRRELAEPAAAISATVTEAARSGSEGSAEQQITWPEVAPQPPAAETAAPVELTPPAATPPAESEASPAPPPGSEPQALLPPPVIEEPAVAVLPTEEAGGVIVHSPSDAAPGTEEMTAFELEARGGTTTTQPAMASDDAEDRGRDGVEAATPPTTLPAPQVTQPEKPASEE